MSPSEGGHSERGASIIEWLLAVSILSMVMGALYELYIQSDTAWRLSSAQYEAQSNARLAMKRFEKELRSAIPPLISADTTSVSFATRAVRTTDTSAREPQTVSYYLSGTQLRRTVAASGQSAVDSPLASYVRNDITNPLFRYYTSTGASATASTASRVAVDLIVDVDQNKNPQSSRLNALYRMRLGD